MGDLADGPDANEVVADLVTDITEADASKWFVADYNLKINNADANTLATGTNLANEDEVTLQIMIECGPNYVFDAGLAVNNNTTAASADRTLVSVTSDTTATITLTWTLP